jgi:hypothetical protein
MRNVVSSAVCSRTHIRTYVHTYVLTYTHTYLRTHIRTYVHTYVLTYTHAFNGTPNSAVLLSRCMHTHTFSDPHLLRVPTAIVIPTALRASRMLSLKESWRAGVNSALEAKFSFMTVNTCMYMCLCRYVYVHITCVCA